MLPVRVEPREDVYRYHMQPLRDAVRFDPAELGRAYDLSKLSAYDRERLGLPPSAAGDRTAAGQDRQGFSIETRDQKERDLVDSMLAQGKSADEIQNALAELRRRRGGEFRQATEVKPFEPDLVKPNSKAVDKYRNDPEQLKGRDLNDVEQELDKELRDDAGWTKKPMRDKNGTAYVDGKGNGVYLNRGYPNATDPLHQGNYVKIMPGDIRIPLAGNPAL